MLIGGRDGGGRSTIMVYARLYGRMLIVKWGSVLADRRLMIP